MVPPAWAMIETVPPVAFPPTAPPPDPPAASALKVTKGAISYHDVHFAYDSGDGEGAGENLFVIKNGKIVDEMNAQQATEAEILEKMM